MLFNANSASSLAKAKQTVEKTDYPSAEVSAELQVKAKTEASKSSAQKGKSGQSKTTKTLDSGRSSTPPSPQSTNSRSSISSTGSADTVNSQKTVTDSPRSQSPVSKNSSFSLNGSDTDIETPVKRKATVLRVDDITDVKPSIDEKLQFLSKPDYSKFKAFIKDRVIDIVFSRYNAVQRKAAKELFNLLFEITPNQQICSRPKIQLEGLANQEDVDKLWHYANAGLTWALLQEEVWGADAQLAPAISTKQRNEIAAIAFAQIFDTTVVVKSADTCKPDLETYQTDSILRNFNGTQLKILNDPAIVGIFNTLEAKAKIISQVNYRLLLVYLKDENNAEAWKCLNAIEDWTNLDVSLLIPFIEKLNEFRKKDFLANRWFGEALLSHAESLRESFEKTEKEVEDKTDQQTQKDALHKQIIKIRKWIGDFGHEIPRSKMCLVLVEYHLDRVQANKELSREKDAESELAQARNYFAHVVPSPAVLRKIPYEKFKLLCDGDVSAINADQFLAFSKLYLPQLREFNWDILNKPCEVKEDEAAKKKVEAAKKVIVKRIDLFYDKVKKLGLLNSNHPEVRRIVAFEKRLHKLSGGVKQESRITSAKEVLVQAIEANVKAVMQAQQPILEILAAIKNLITLAEIDSSAVAQSSQAIKALLTAETGLLSKLLVTIPVTTGGELLLEFLKAHHFEKYLVSHLKDFLAAVTNPKNSNLECQNACLMFLFENENLKKSTLDLIMVQDKDSRMSFWKKFGAMQLPKQNKPLLLFLFSGNLNPIHRADQKADPVDFVTLLESQRESYDQKGLYGLTKESCKQARFDVNFLLETCKVLHERALKGSVSHLTFLNAILYSLSESNLAELFKNPEYLLALYKTADEVLRKKISDFCEREILSSDEKQARALTNEQQLACFLVASFAATQPSRDKDNGGWKAAKLLTKVQDPKVWAVIRDSNFVWKDEAGSHPTERLLKYSDNAATWTLVAAHPEIFEFDATRVNKILHELFIKVPQEEKLSDQARREFSHINSVVAKALFEITTLKNLLPKVHPLLIGQILKTKSHKIDQNQIVYLIELLGGEKGAVILDIFKNKKYCETIAAAEFKKLILLSNQLNTAQRAALVKADGLVDGLLDSSCENLRLAAAFIKIYYANPDVGQVKQILRQAKLNGNFLALLLKLLTEYPFVKNKNSLIVQAIAQEKELRDCFAQATVIDPENKNAVLLVFELMQNYQPWVDRLDVKTLSNFVHLLSDEQIDLIFSNESKQFNSDFRKQLNDKEDPADEGAITSFKHKLVTQVLQSTAVYLVDEESRQNTGFYQFVAVATEVQLVDAVNVLASAYLECQTGQAHEGARQVPVNQEKAKVVQSKLHAVFASIASERIDLVNIPYTLRDQSKAHFVFWIIENRSRVLPHLIQFATKHSGQLLVSVLQQLNQSNPLMDLFASQMICCLKVELTAPQVKAIVEQLLKIDSLNPVNQKFILQLVNSILTNLSHAQHLSLAEFNGLIAIVAKFDLIKENKSVSPYKACVFNQLLGIQAQILTAKKTLSSGEGLTNIAQNFLDHIMSSLPNNVGIIDGLLGKNRLNSSQGKKLAENDPLSLLTPEFIEVLLQLKVDIEKYKDLKASVLETAKVKTTQFTEEYIASLVTQCTAEELVGVLTTRKSYCVSARGTEQKNSEEEQAKAKRLFLAMVASEKCSSILLTDLTKLSGLIKGLGVTPAELFDCHKSIKNLRLQVFLFILGEWTLLKGDSSSYPTEAKRTVSAPVVSNDGRDALSRDKKTILDCIDKVLNSEAGITADTGLVFDSKIWKVIFTDSSEFLKVLKTLCSQNTSDTKTIKIRSAAVSSLKKYFAKESSDLEKFLVSLNEDLDGSGSTLRASVLKTLRKNGLVEDQAIIGTVKRKDLFALNLHLMKFEDFENRGGLLDWHIKNLKNPNEDQTKKLFVLLEKNQNLLLTQKNVLTTAVFANPKWLHAVCTENKPEFDTVPRTVRSVVVKESLSQNVLETSFNAGMKNAFSGLESKQRKELIDGFKREQKKQNINVDEKIPAQKIKAHALKAFENGCVEKNTSKGIAFDLNSKKTTALMVFGCLTAGAGFLLALTGYLAYLGIRKAVNAVSNAIWPPITPQSVWGEDCLAQRTNPVLAALGPAQQQGADTPLRNTRSPILSAERRFQQHSANSPVVPNRTVKTAIKEEDACLIQHSERPAISG